MGFVRRSAKTIGNVWVDLTRTTLWILIPLSAIFALLLASQGVIQNLSPYTEVQTIETQTWQEPVKDLNGEIVLDKEGQPELEAKSSTTQTLAMGPVASQLSIKLLGTNGGGFFNTNSAHPFENPTPLANFMEMLCIFLIPAALCFTFGNMVADKRQGFAIFSAMFVMFTFLHWASLISNKWVILTFRLWESISYQALLRPEAIWKARKSVSAFRPAACSQR